MHFHYITCHSLHRHYFCSVRDTHLKFSDRIWLWYCNNMTLTINIYYRFENRDILGVSVHFPCLIVFLNGNRIKIAVNCPHYIPLQTCNKNKFIFGKFHCFFRKIFRWCLTFDAVYTYMQSRLTVLQL